MTRYRLRLAIALILSSVSLILSGCVVPGYPYNGVAPVGTVCPTGGPPPVGVAPAYYYPTAPVVIAPSFFPGFGYGYWYRGGYWPYHNGCGFYNGGYYGGCYHGNYGWHGGGYGCGGWH